VAVNFTEPPSEGVPLFTTVTGELNGIADTVIVFGGLEETGP
jgi:hypothetical protein